MRESFSDATKAYSGIMKQKEKSGKFRKTLLHVHTPASYDYKLLGKFTDQDYLNATDQEIYNECISKRVFPNVFSNIKQIKLW